MITIPGTVRENEKEKKIKDKEKKKEKINKVRGIIH